MPAKTRAELEATLKTIVSQVEAHEAAATASVEALVSMAKLRPDSFIGGPDNIDAYQTQMEQAAELMFLTLGLALVEEALRAKISAMVEAEEAAAA